MHQKPHLPSKPCAACGRPFTWRKKWEKSGTTSVTAPTAAPDPEPPGMTILRLIFGDQLNPHHPWFDDVRPDIIYLLMEIRQETDYVLHHAQKILAIFSAMRDFARQLADYAADCAIPVQAVDSGHFYTTRDEAAQCFQGRKQWWMEHFYRQLRQRHRVLLTADGKPEGGQWNFDHDNRKPWRGEPPEPPNRRRRHDHSALWRTITDAGVSSFGETGDGAIFHSCFHGGWLRQVKDGQTVAGAGVTVIAMTFRISQHPHDFPLRIPHNGGLPLPVSAP